MKPLLRQLLDRWILQIIAGHTNLKARYTFIKYPVADLSLQEWTAIYQLIGTQLRMARYTIITWMLIISAIPRYLQTTVKYMIVHAHWTANRWLACKVVIGDGRTMDIMTILVSSMIHSILKSCASIQSIQHN